MLRNTFDFQRKMNDLTLKFSTFCSFFLAIPEKRLQSFRPSTLAEIKLSLQDTGEELQIRRMQYRRSKIIDYIESRPQKKRKRERGGGRG